MTEIRHYVSRAGKDVFDDWLSRLDDSRAQAKIAIRINRLAVGNFGDCKALGQGLYELRIDWGPGYRVYFGRDGDTLVILLTGGIKKRQQRDIAEAKELWTDYKRRRKPSAR